MTGVCHHALLIGWDGVLTNFFCLSWLQTVILPISVSQGAGITGMSHHTQPEYVFFNFKGKLRISCYSS
jgi:hypothetical protein